LKDDKDRIIIIDEKIHQSIFRDIFSFFTLLAAFWVNYNFMGNGIVLQLILGAVWFMAMCARSNKFVNRLGPEDAIVYLSEKYKDNSIHREAQ